MNYYPIVKIGSTQLERGDVHWVEVSSDLNAVDSCLVEIDAQGTTGQQMNELKLGETLRISAGRDDAEPVPLFFGQVSEIRPQFGTGKHGSFQIQAFNPLYKLAKNELPSTFLNEAASDIAILQHIMGEADLDFKTDVEGIKHDYFMSAGGNNLELAFWLAKQRQGDLYVDENGTVRFEVSDVGDAISLAFPEGDPSAVAMSDSDITRFSASCSSSDLVQKVAVHGWDPVKKEAIIEEVEAPTDAQRRQTAAISAVGEDDASKSAVDYITSPAIRTQESAAALANAIMQERLGSYMTGEVVGRNPLLRPGKYVSLDMPNNPRFAGVFSVTGSEHIFRPEGTDLYSSVIRVARSVEGAAS